MELAVNGSPAYAYTGGKAFDPALPVVVLIHGAQQDHSCWHLQARSLAYHGRAVLAPDLPAHGRSSDSLKILPGVSPVVGRTQAEAHDALLHFLERAFKQGKRKVLIITGKGMTQSKSGILKANVPRWLNEPAFRRLVLALSQARPEHGGEGALYVLLKRQR